MPPSSRLAREQSEIVALRAIVVAILKTLKQGNNSPLAPIVVGNINIGPMLVDDEMLETEHVQEAIARILDEAGLNQ